MEYVILHNDIDKIYIDLLVRWENIQNKISEYGAFDFAAKKNDRYVVAGEKLSVKEIKELKMLAVGKYPELYMKYPDVVVSNGDIAVLTEEILGYVEDKTSAKWDFLKYFDYFYIEDGEYWDRGNVNCLMLKMYDYDYASYYMNDYNKSNSAASNDKSQLQENGIWDGYVVNRTDGRFFMFKGKRIYFTDILKLKCIPIETKNIYHYKMTKD